MADIVRPEDAHRLMWEMSLGEFLDEAVRRDPHKVFVEMSGRELTYSEFRQAAWETAALFQSMGVGKGDRVNGVHWLTAQTARIKLNLPNTGDRSRHARIH